MPPQMGSCCTISATIKITTRNVRKALKAIDISKSAGPDGVPGIVLKNCAMELAPVLTRLFNMSLKSGVFPDEWKLAHVTPIHKKGDKSNSDNYRPISVTSTVSKVFETVINKQLLQQLKKTTSLQTNNMVFINVTQLVTCLLL